MFGCPGSLAEAVLWCQGCSRGQVSDARMITDSGGGSRPGGEGGVILVGKFLVASEWQDVRPSVSEMGMPQLCNESGIPLTEGKGRLEGTGRDDGATKSREVVPCLAGY